MINNKQELFKCINGSGNITAFLKFESIQHIRLRPNVIFDIVDNKKVIHLGCTDHIEIINQKLNSGLYLHKQLSEVSKKCIGIDINTTTVQYIRERGFDNVIIGDITKPKISQIECEQWDFLLMAEILEHIDNPVEFLKDIVENYKHNINKIIITVPNAFGLIHMNNALSTGNEIVNSDHRYWFTPYTLWKVIHQAGLVLEDIKMCLYENSVGILGNNSKLLKEKPILLDTIVAVCSYTN